MENDELAEYLNARKKMGARDVYDRRMTAFLAGRSGTVLDKKTDPAQMLAFMNAVYMQNLACYQAAAARAGAYGGGAV